MQKIVEKNVKMQKKNTNDGKYTKMGGNDKDTKLQKLENSRNEKVAKLFQKFRNYRNYIIPQ